MAPNTKRVFYVNNVAAPVYLEILAKRPDMPIAFDWLSMTMILGLLVTSIFFVLYLAQETVGLPGLPKMWCPRIAQRDS